MDTINDCVSHLVHWFLDLNAIRTINIISGMGGGGVIYNAIQPTEIEAWGRITGNQPTIREIAFLRQMDSAYINEKSARDNKKSGTSGKQHQAVGEYCGNEKVDECRAYLGSALDATCATCPN